MNIDQSIVPPRQAAVQGLAVVGFIALVAAGIWLSVYSTRYVPTVVNRVSVAAVYLGSVFTPAPPASLSVVPTATTISFGEASSTISTSVDSTQTPIKSTKQNWTPGTPVAVTNGTTTPNTPVIPHYSGLSDLSIAIENVGYEVVVGDNNIVATTTIPAHTQIAIKFRVTNVGTNVSGPWTMNVSIPSGGTSASQTFSQDSLVPTQPSEYIARFNNISPGTGYVINVTIDPNHQLSESDTANNVATSTSLTVLGN